MCSTPNRPASKVPESNEEEVPNPTPSTSDLESFLNSSAKKFHWSDVHMDYVAMNDIILDMSLCLTDLDHLHMLCQRGVTSTDCPATDDRLDAPVLMQKVRRVLKGVHQDLDNVNKKLRERFTAEEAADAIEFRELKATTQAQYEKSDDGVPVRSGQSKEGCEKQIKDLRERAAEAKGQVKMDDAIGAVRTLGVQVAEASAGGYRIELGEEVEMAIEGMKFRLKKEWEDGEGGWRC